MRIGYRTIKTALAAPIATWIAELLQLDNYGSAGIIAVLCILPTRKRSLLTAWHRIAAGLLSVIYAYVIFEFIGYHPISIGLLLVLFIPVTIYFKIVPGIVTSLVVLFHFYAARSVSWSLIGNEVGLMLIGIGTALVLNMYMPSLDSKLQTIQKTVERNYQKIFKDLAVFLHKKENHTLPSGELAESRQLIHEAELIVMRDVENRFFREEHVYKQYFTMRKMQLDLLDRMLLQVSLLPKEAPEQSTRIAQLFDYLAVSIYPENTVQEHLEAVEKLKNHFEQDKLPETREEFEARAHLFQLLYEIEQYLLIKNRSLTSD